MDPYEEQLHLLAVTIIGECGEQAHDWTLRRAAGLRSEGDGQRAQFWERVAAIVAEIQARPSQRRDH